MRLLLDENMGEDMMRPLRAAGHEVENLRTLRWTGKKNGELMRLIAESNFNVFITGDKNLPFQQNLNKLTTGLWVLDAPSNDIQTLMRFIPAILETLGAFGTGNPIPKTLRYISIPEFRGGKKKRKP